MNLARFLEHWSVTENPFRAQEARHDRVFARLEITANSHPDFEKILGDLHSPSTSIVFGEKGSGKTAIRLQLAERIREHNAAHPEEKVFLVGYDDLNPTLDWFAARYGVTTESSDVEIEQTLGRLRLVDHMDGILHFAVTRIVDAILGQRTPGSDTQSTDLGEHPDRVLRQADPRVRRDLLLLQAIYDKDGETAERARALRRLIHAPKGKENFRGRMIASLGWILPAAVLGYMVFQNQKLAADSAGTWVAAIAGIAWIAFTLKHLFWSRFQLGRLANRVWRDVRTPPRTKESLRRCLELVPREDREASILPTDDREDVRYAMQDRLRNVLHGFGFRGVLVVLDRIDEPTLVNGHAARMRNIIWPLLRNKFLQQHGIGFKMLLPLELHREVFRESSEFFQEVRLDKQNLVEQLTWTGAMLYDLCNARLNACKTDEAEGNLSLAEMFAEDVTRQDVVDALDQMHRPRDAFKLLYEVMLAHCSNFSEEQSQWRIPRLVLDNVRQQQADRVQAFHRGFRPA